MTATEQLAAIDAMSDGPAKHLALIAWNRENTAGWQEPPEGVIEALEAEAGE